MYPTLFLLFPEFLLLQKNLALHLIKLERPFLNNALIVPSLVEIDQVVLHGEKDENVKS